MRSVVSRPAAACRLGELDSDADEKLFEAQRPAILNGIEELAERADLLDRCLLFHLPSIPESKRRSEADLWRAFEAAQPGIMGALLDAVSAALRTLPSVHLDNLPRMADFAVWVSAAESALGWEAGTFTDAYSANRREAVYIGLDASPVADVLLSRNPVTRVTRVTTVCGASLRTCGKGRQANCWRF